MLNKLFARLTGADDAASRDQTADAADDQTPLAVAALLVEAARADEDYSDTERGLIDHMLAARFELPPADVVALRERAEEAQAAAIDLYQFSRVVKAEMAPDEKANLIEDMWVIALSDNERAPYEEMIIRRLIGLIHLTDTESTSARRRAEARLAASQ